MSAASARRWIALAAAGVVAAGLGLFFFAPRAAAHCPSWTVAMPDGCRSRAWVLPATNEGFAGAALQLRGLALDDRGLGVAAWQRTSSGRASIEIGEELAPGRWETRGPQVPDAGEDTSPAISAGAGRAALAVWLRVGAGSAVMTRERDASGVWRDGAQPLSLPSRAVEPTVALGPTGEQLVAWCQETAGKWGVSLAHRAGPEAAWQRPARAEDVVSPDILFANQPQVALDARGDALVTWYQSEGAPLMTYVSERRGASGAFSRPAAAEHVSACCAPVSSDPIANPKAALGPHGEAAVVWVQENGAGGAPVYLATRDATGPWLTPRDLSASFSPASGTATTAGVAFGPGGELYVVWRQRDATGSAVYAARRNAAGRWVEPGREAVRLSGGNAYSPVLAVGPEGGVLAAWVEQDAARGERIAVRRTGADRSSWEPVEWLTPAPGPVAFLQAAMGPRDRALVGWVAGGIDARLVFARMD
jgi:hypothetical protein